MHQSADRMLRSSQACSVLAMPTPVQLRLMAQHGEMYDWSECERTCMCSEVTWCARTHAPHHTAHPALPGAGDVARKASWAQVAMRTVTFQSWSAAVCMLPAARRTRALQSAGYTSAPAGGAPAGLRRTVLHGGSFSTCKHAMCCRRMHHKRGSTTVASTTATSLNVYNLSALTLTHAGAGVR